MSVQQLAKRLEKLTNVAKLHSFIQVDCKSCPARLYRAGRTHTLLAMQLWRFKWSEVPE